MENTLERIAKCRFETKMDKRSGFWQVDLTRAAQELLAFVTPKGRVMPFVAFIQCLLRRALPLLCALRPARCTSRLVAFTLGPVHYGCALCPAPSALYGIGRDRPCLTPSVNGDRCSAAHRPPSDNGPLKRSPLGGL